MRRLLLILILCGLPALLAAQEPPPVAELKPGPGPLEALVGEDLNYDIAFLWFDRLAEARLTFSQGEQAGTYRAVLEARTLGVAAWLTRDRIQRYESLMEVAPNGRLRTLTYESRIIKGKGKSRTDRGKKYTFDYLRNQVRFQRFREEQFLREEMLPMMADNPPSDILSAFYNFRTGAFGPVAPGGHYVVPAFSRKGDSDILVDLLTGNPRTANPFFPAGGLLAKVAVDPEVFDTGGGSVYVWFDNFGRPARGIVEQVIGLGDVRGTLRQ